MTGPSYPVVLHQGGDLSKDSASVNSMATRSSANSRPSSITSGESYLSANSASMWSDREGEDEAALIASSISRVNKQTGTTVTVWNPRS